MQRTPPTLFSSKAKYSRSGRPLKPSSRLTCCDEHTAEALQEEKSVSEEPIPIKRSKPNPESSRAGATRYWGRAVHSDGIVVTVTSEAGSHIEADGSFFSPGAKVREVIREQKDYVSPSKTEVTQVSENGSVERRRKKTPSKREYVLSFTVYMIIPPSNNILPEQKIRIEFFQTAESAAQAKKPANVTAEDLQKARDCPQPVSDTYKITRDKITEDRLKEAAESRHEISAQHRYLKASAIGADAGFEGAFEHSHMEAHRHGQRHSEAEVKEGIQADRYRTFPATREHNGMRLVTAEIPAFKKKCIELLGLYYSDIVKLLKDKQGNPLPIIQFEDVIWEDDQGNKLHFKYKALNNVTPAMQLENFTEVLVEEAFPAPPQRRLF
ncbi:MAG: hypothetical protein ACD_60C00143G0043 [uncultured bacterium]|nr:MAG: hypothetical protein ACD_60C00143G0043 [uncultured bacterium]